MYILYSQIILWNLLTGKSGVTFFFSKFFLFVSKSMDRWIFPFFFITIQNRLSKIRVFDKTSWKLLQAFFELEAQSNFQIEEISIMASNILKQWRILIASVIKILHSSSINFWRFWVQQLLALQYSKIIQDNFILRVS